jgi:hypothetical protein
MKVEKELTAAETLKVAEDWYHRQLDVLAKCHGDRWPLFSGWLSEYLKEELRQRLIDKGWRRKR